MLMEAKKKATRLGDLRILINAFSYELLQTSSFSLLKASHNALSYEPQRERRTSRKNA